MLWRTTGAHFSRSTTTLPHGTKTLLSLLPETWLCWHETILDPEITPISPQWKPVLFVSTDRNTHEPMFRNRTGWAVLRASPLSSTDHKLSTTLDDSHTLLPFYQHILENLGLVGKVYTNNCMRVNTVTARCHSCVPWFSSWFHSHIDYRRSQGWDGSPPYCVSVFF